MAHCPPPLGVRPPGYAPVTNSNFSLISNQYIPNGWSIIFSIRAISVPQVKVALGAHAALCPSPSSCSYATGDATNTSPSHPLEDFQFLLAHIVYILFEHMNCTTASHKSPSALDKHIALFLENQDWRLKTEMYCTACEQWCLSKVSLIVCTG